jgi:CO dehydrogenase maturation factor
VRVALAGKGGAGKTTLTATMARLLARRGHEVVALDADSNPNLAAALGLPGHDVPWLPAGIVSRRLDGGPRLREPVDDLVGRCASSGPDGIRLLAMGEPAHAEAGCLCSAHATVRALLADLGARPATMTLVDLEASPEHLSRGTARHADVMLLVTEPYFRSLETVRRLALLAAELPIPVVGVVVNKVRSAADHQAVDEFCARHALRWLGDVPWSDEVGEADRRRQALVDVAPGGSVVTAVDDLVAAVLALGATVPAGGDA